MERKKRAFVAVITVVMLVLSMFGTAFADEIAANMQGKAEPVFTEVSKNEDTVEKDGGEEKLQEKQTKEEQIEEKGNGNQIANSSNTEEKAKSEGAESEIDKNVVSESNANNEKAGNDMSVFIAEGSTNEMAVKVFAPEGTFPAKTTMTVKRANAAQVKELADEATGDDFKVVDVVAVDITFKHKGKEIQPANGNKVDVKLSAKRELKGESQKAVHVKNGKADILGKASKKEASLKAKAFSVYAIIGGTYETSPTSTSARYTYKFYDEVQGTDVVDTQIICDGETLYLPYTPGNQPKKIFSGWRDENGDEVKFGEPISTGTEDKTIIVRAHYVESYRVTFWKDDEKTTVVQMKEAANGTDVRTDDVTLNLGNGQVITGWHREGSTASVTSVTLNGADVDLFPIVTNPHVIVFNSMGGTPVASAFVEDGQLLSEPAAPTRSGFTFKGWYKDSGYTEAYNFDTQVTSNFTLYAMWEGNPAAYKVVHWKQNANDDGYTFAEMETLSGNAGTLATYEAKTYEGFGESSSNAPVVIKGDGTTIQNVYYDRKTYPLKFYLYEDSHVLRDGFTSRAAAEEYMNTLNASDYPGLKVESYTYWFSTRYRVVWGDLWVVKAQQDFKYGQDTSEFWNTVSTQYQDTRWKTTQNGNTAYTYAPPMAPTSGSLSEFSGISVYGEFNDNESFIYYRDVSTNTDIRERFRVNGGKSFWIFGDNWYFTEEDFVEIPGYTFVRSEGPDYEGGFIGIGSEYVGYLYYAKNKYTLRMVTNVSGEDDIVESGIEFKQDLSEFEPEDYKIGETTRDFDGITKTFAGWYTDEACSGEPFNFNTTMPALPVTNTGEGDKATLVLYGKWTAGFHTISFDLDGGTYDGNDTIPSQNVESGTQATLIDSSKMSKDGFIFIGFRDQSGRLFSFDNLITEDYELTAVWGSDNTTVLKVAYDAGDKGTFTEVDTNSYVSGAITVLKGFPTVNKDYADQGWIFKGWKIGKSNELVSYGIFVVKDTDAEIINDVPTVKLTAQYEQRAMSTQVTYHDGDTKSVYVDSGLGINEDYKIKGFKDVGFSREGWVFTGWNTKADGNGDTFQPGEIVAVSRIPGDLYALYREENKVDILIKGAQSTVGYDGTEQEVKGFTFEAKDKDGNDLSGEVTVALKSEHSDKAEVKGTDVKVDGTDGNGLPIIGAYQMGLKEEYFDIALPSGRDMGTVTIEDGFLKIEPYKLVLEVIGNSNTVTFNGNEQSVAGFVAKSQIAIQDLPSGFDIKNVMWKKGQTPEAKGTDAGGGTGTAPDYPDGAYPMGLIADDFTFSDTNYAADFQVIDGWLNIEPVDDEVTVMVVGRNGTVKYDGKEHIVSGYDLQISDARYKESDFEFSGTAEAKRTEVGTTNMGLDASQFKNTSANFTNVTFKVTDGWLKIEEATPSGFEETDKEDDQENSNPNEGDSNFKEKKDDSDSASEKIDSGSEKKKDDSDSAPTTGDSNGILMFAVIAIASLIGLFVVAKKRKAVK